MTHTFSRRQIEMINNADYSWDRPSYNRRSNYSRRYNTTPKHSQEIIEVGELMAKSSVLGTVSELLRAGSESLARYENLGVVRYNQHYANGSFSKYSFTKAFFGAAVRHARKLNINLNYEPVTHEVAGGEELVPTFG